MKKILCVFTVFAMMSTAAFAADSFRVSLYQKTTINGTEFKVGDVKLEISGDKAILKQGKTSTEVPVKIENATDKFIYTTVAYESGSTQVKEIDLAGTTKKLLVSGAISSK